MITRKLISIAINQIKEEYKSYDRIDELAASLEGKFDFIEHVIASQGGGKDDFLNMRLEDVFKGERIKGLNSLVESGVVFMGDLLKKTSSELNSTQGMGPEGVLKIMNKLSEHGLNLSNVQQELL